MSQRGECGRGRRGGRGGFSNVNNNTVLRRSLRFSQPQKVDIIEEDDDSIFCYLCPPGRPAMSKRSVEQGTFCTNCNAAYHPGCIKKCIVYHDGSVSECCGFQDVHPNKNLNRTHDPSVDYEDQVAVNNPSQFHEQHDLSNYQLKDILVKKMDNIAKQLTSFDMRLTKNENDINLIKKSISLLQDQVKHTHKIEPVQMVSTVLSEQDDRNKRQRNIIIYNIPEFNKNTPINENERKEFYKDLTSYNKSSIEKILSTIDPELAQPVYSRRIGKYQNDKIRPFLLSFSDINSVKTIFLNLQKLKSSPELQTIIIKRDLTANQRETVKLLKKQCDELNTKNNNPNYTWVVSYSNSNPIMTKHQKNRKTLSPQTKISNTT